MELLSQGGFTFALSLAQDPATEGLGTLAAPACWQPHGPSEDHTH